MAFLVPTGAEEVRAAYRRAALAAHPDKGGSAEAFHDVAAAFEALSCPAAGQVSEHGRAAKRPPPAGPPAAPAARRRRGAPAAAEGGGGAAPKEDAAAGGAAQSRDDGRAARLGRVRALLQCMDKESRDASILGMPPRVRAALVDFMRGPGGGAQEQEPDEPAAQQPPPRGRRGSGAVRLREVRSRAGAKYSAQLDIESLRIYTRQVPLEDALEAQLALARARDRLSSAGPEVWESPEEVCAVFEAALRDRGATAGQWGLAVFVQMRAPEMVASSLAITSPAMALPQAVELRRRLLAVRAGPWQRFRAEWVALLTGGRRGLPPAEAAAAADAARRDFVSRRLADAVRDAERDMSGADSGPRGRRGAARPSPARLGGGAVAAGGVAARGRGAPRGPREPPAPYLCRSALREHDAACAAAGPPRR